ncbi:hypothetical protein ACFQ6S_20565 [Streptomyces sp. NPDC056479]|uniref:hypothetical protein n=1 Tax=Streptomyces sp. NPDC056479 TaxID=3345832 RepID=UPI00368CC659
MPLGIRKLAVVGAAALGVIALSAPSASATSQQSDWVKMAINPNCHIKLYVDDHQYAGKIRAQAHFTCDKGGNLFTPYISIDRDNQHGLGRKTAGPKWIDKDTGFGGFETTTANKSGRQCYKAVLQIVYPEPGEGGNTTQFVKTPCLNT